MITLVFCISAFLAGYACRGFLHTELADADAILDRLETAAKQDSATLRVEVSNVITEIRSKI
jgi:hypothetical protein